MKLANNVSQFCTFFYIIIILKTKAQFLYMMKKKSMELFLYHYYEIFSFHRQRNLCVNIFFCKTWWLKHFAAHLNRKKIIWSLLEMTHKCALLSPQKNQLYAYAPNSKELYYIAQNQKLLFRGRSLLPCESLFYNWKKPSDLIMKTPFSSSIYHIFICLNFLG